jgi:hypothetical protein
VKKSLEFTVLSAILLFIFIGCSATPGLSPDMAKTTEAGETNFVLDIVEPADNSVVEARELEIKGHTIPEATVSINGDLTFADSDGLFEITIILEEGPNIIEIIASDDEGNEARTSLAVACMKGG